VQLVFNIFNLYGHDLQTDRQTDGRALHCSASRGKKQKELVEEGETGEEQSG